MKVRKAKQGGPPPPALSSYPYWNAAKQVARFCAGEDEAREYAEYLRELDCPATAVLPSEFPKMTVPVVVLRPCLPWLENPTGPSYGEESSLYDNFKCYEMQSRATDQHRNLKALLGAHEREKSGIRREEILCLVGAAALPGIEPGLQHHVGYLYRKLKQGEVSTREWDEEVCRLIQDGKVQKPGPHPGWKSQVLLWEGDEDCSSAPSMRFKGKLWTISKIDQEFQLYLGGNRIPGVRLLFFSNAVALAEAYEKVMGNPPASVMEALETLIGKRIRLQGYGGESDVCGRLAAVTDDTIAVVLEGVSESARCQWYSRYNGRSLISLDASSGRKITEGILKALDDQFPKMENEPRSPSERPRRRLLARVADAQSAQDWFDSTPGVEVIDLDELIGIGRPR